MGLFDDLFANKPRKPNPGGGDLFGDLFGNGEEVEDSRVDDWRSAALPAGQIDAEPSFARDAWRGILDSAIPDVGDVGSSLMAGLARVPLSATNAVDFATQIYGPRALSNALGVNQEVEAHTQEMLDKVRAPLERAVDYWTPDDDRSFLDAPIQRTLNTAAQGLPILGTMAAAGPVAALPLGGLLEGGEAFADAQDRDVSLGASIATGLGVGAINSVLERIGLDSALGRLPWLKPADGAALLQRAAVAAMGEGATEAAQELVNMAGQVATGKTIDRDELVDRVLTSFAGGAGAGGALRAARHASDTDFGGHGDDLRAWVGRELGVQQGLPGQIFHAKEAADARIARNDLEAGYVADGFRIARSKYLKANRGTDAAQLDAQLHEYLTADESARWDGSVSAPAELLPHLDQMRSMIDRRSLDLLAEPGLVKDEYREVVEGNIGTYTRRSFAVHDDPNWLSTVEGTQEWNDAATFLRTQEPGKSDAEIEGMLRVLATHEPDVFRSQGGSGLGTKDLTILRHRKEIEEPLLKVMGEYADPAVNFVKTLERTNRTLARHKMYNAIREGGLGEIFFENPTGDAYIPVGGKDGADQFGAIGGLYTTPNLAKALDQSMETQSAGVLGIVNGIVKAGLTIGSPQAHFRNAESNFLALAAGGHLFMPFKPGARPGRGAKRLLEGYRVGATGHNIFGLADADHQALYLDAVEHGVVGGNVDVGDVRFYLRDLAERLGRGGKAAQAINAIGGHARKSYELNDDSFKLAAYWSEVEGLKHALGDSVSQGEIKVMAAERVKQTMQNYNRLPKAVQRLRQVPIAGPFVSFPTAVMINAKNGIAIGLQDLRHKNPRMRMLGAHRLGSMGATIFGATGLMAATAQALAGTEWADEEDSAMREFVPHFGKLSEYAIIEKEPGKIKAIDLSFLDYYAPLKRPFLAALRAGAVDDNAFAAAVATFAEPYVGEEIAVGGIIDVMRNLDHYGNPVYAENATAGTKVRRSIGHLYDGLKPGVLKTAERIRSRDTGAEALAAVGPRVTTVDVRRSLQGRAFRHNAALSNASRNFGIATQTARTVAPGSMAQELADGAEGARRSFEGLERAFHAAQTLGIPEPEVRKLLAVPGMSAEIREGMGEVSTAVLFESWLDRRIESLNKRRAENAKSEFSEWRSKNPFATPQEVREQELRITSRWRDLTVHDFQRR